MKNMGHYLGCTVIGDYFLNILGHKLDPNKFNSSNSVNVKSKTILLLRGTRQVKQFSVNSIAP